MNKTRDEWMIRMNRKIPKGLDGKGLWQRREDRRRRTGEKKQINAGMLVLAKGKMRGRPRTEVTSVEHPGREPGSTGQGGQMSEGRGMMAG